MPTALEIFDALPGDGGVYAGLTAAIREMMSGVNLETLTPEFSERLDLKQAEIGADFTRQAIEQNDAKSLVSLQSWWLTFARSDVDSVRYEGEKWAKVTADALARVEHTGVVVQDIETLESAGHTAARAIVSEDAVAVAAAEADALLVIEANRLGRERIEAALKAGTISREGLNLNSDGSVASVTIGSPYYYQAALIMDQAFTEVTGRPANNAAQIAQLFPGVSGPIPPDPVIMAAPSSPYSGVVPPPVLGTSQAFTPSASSANLSTTGGVAGQADVGGIPVPSARSRSLVPILVLVGAVLVLARGFK